MLHPFAPLTKPLLDAFVKADKKYFVRQTYHRGKELLDDNIKGCFIFTHYNEISEAERHVNAIPHDRHRFLYDWNKYEDQQRLLKAASSPAGYKIYSGVLIKDWLKLTTRILKSKARKYIDNSLGWRPGSGDTVDVIISSNYGELYAEFKLRSRENRVKLEVIEEL